MEGGRREGGRKEEEERRKDERRILIGLLVIYSVTLHPRMCGRDSPPKWIHITGVVITYLSRCSPDTILLRFII